MKKRISGAQRIELQSVAEKEILKYKDDHYLWHKHVHNVDLDAVQVLKCEEMDKHRLTVDFSSRRMGKTAIKELYNLKFLACNPDQELGVVAPREAQSVVNLNYHLDSIRRSPMLTAFVDVVQGRQQMATTYYKFSNRSQASAYGIMANVDGGDLTMASVEEVDDMPHERLFSRFLLMLGSARRLGASKKSKNDPQIRITGVYKGATTLVDLIGSGQYHAIGAFHGDRAKQEIRRMIDAGYLMPSQVNPDQYQYPVPIGNAVNGMMLGLLNKQFILSMRDSLGEDEFARQLLCINTASRNLIWEEWLQRAVQLGVKAQLEPVIPVPGQTYKKRGLLSFGYDHTGHGENPTSSKSSLVVSEDLGGFLVPIFAKTWPVGTDESVIRRDLLSFWKYFKPDSAMGDSFGVGLINALCIDLYKNNLTTINVETLEKGQSHWNEWPFIPVRFEGTQKFMMATELATAFSGGRVALPYVNHIKEGDEDYNDVEALQNLYKQLTNIESISTSKSYASFKMVKRSLGDDLFDAQMVGCWALRAGGQGVITKILLGGTSSLESGFKKNQQGILVPR